MLGAGAPIAISSRPRPGIDVTPDKMTVSIFMWRPPQPVSDIDTSAARLRLRHFPSTQHGPSVAIERSNMQ